MKKIVIFVLLLGFLTGLAGCQKDNPVRTGKDLMEGIRPEKAEQVEDISADSAAVVDFEIRLFQQSLAAGENTLISPLSVLCALSMTANGAEADTLAQMEAVMGLPVDKLNGWMHSWLTQFSDRDGLHLANAIWMKEDVGFIPKKEFLQTNGDYYGAAIYQAPFDRSTCEDINRWVAENTDGLIQSALDEIPEDTIMYLLNAQSFDAKWGASYKSNQFWDGVFTTETGDTRNVEMMASEEHWYLEDELATGFMKSYRGDKFAFVAMLPNEGVTMENYVNSLTAEGLLDMLNSPWGITVFADIPKFETDYETPMNQILENMGMPNAFYLGLADFSGMGTVEEGNIYINRILHKTVISVTAEGTKAAAETTVEMNAPSAPPPGQEVYITLNRPFFYMIVDMENKIPVFMGVLMDTEG